MTECKVLGCDRPAVAQGLCDGHYRRMKKGKPLDSPVRKVTRGMTLAERLAEYTDRRGDDECWPWTCGCDKDGYGEISTGGSSKHRRAHVVAWELANGRSVPPGYCVLHTCDYPPCVNPGHLFLGTNLDNIRDRDDKFRQAHGSSHPKAKLTEDAVREIRDLAFQGVRQADIARRFNVTQANILAIVKRKTWTHIR